MSDTDRILAGQFNRRGFMRMAGTTTLGAAVLAAVASGVHASVAEAVSTFVAYQPDEHQPDPELGEVYADAYRRYRDVYRALRPVFSS